MKTKTKVFKGIKVAQKGQKLCMILFERQYKGLTRGCCSKHAIWDMSQALKQTLTLTGDLVIEQVSPSSTGTGEPSIHIAACAVDTGVVGQTLIHVWDTKTRSVGRKVNRSVGQHVKGQANDWM